MNLNFQKVTNEPVWIDAIYEVLRLAGLDMLNNQGLVHWSTPYPKDKIAEDCMAKDVFIVTDGIKAVATFQLKEVGNMYELSKFAVIPSVAGKGIGGKCLGFMEQKCREKGLKGINLDVYDQSSVAISFYRNKGFIQVGTKPTRHFQVLLMEKIL